MHGHFLELASLAGVWALAVMLPGPNFLLVSQSALQDRFRQGLGAALGISLGAAIWAASSLLGLALLFREFQWLYGVFRVAGGCYLVWIGLKNIRAGLRPKGSPLRARTIADGRSPILLGLLTSLSNPKTAAFFAGMFATLLSPEAPLRVQAAALFLVFAISLAWYSWLAAAFSAPPVRRAYRLARRPLDLLLGALFAFLGIRLATPE